jgi:polar amino acid transport system substrate-binding protein
MKFILSAIFLLAVTIVPVQASSITVTSMEGSAYTELNKRIMEEVYKRAGLSLSVVTYPAKRALQISNSGEVDGELFRIANLNKKWPNLLPVPTPIAYLEGVDFSRSVTFEVNDWESLRPYNIAIKRGILHAERGTEGMNRQILDSNRQLFKALINGRVDVIVLAKLNALVEINANQFRGIKQLNPPIFKLPVFHYLHQKHEALIPVLDKIIRDLNDDGTIQKITYEYIQELEKKKSNDILN